MQDACLELAGQRPGLCHHNVCRSYWYPDNTQNFPARCTPVLQRPEQEQQHNVEFQYMIRGNLLASGSVHVPAYTEQDNAEQFTVLVQDSNIFDLVKLSPLHTEAETERRVEPMLTFKCANWSNHWERQLMFWKVPLIWSSLICQCLSSWVLRTCRHLERTLSVSYKLATWLWLTSKGQKPPSHLQGQNASLKNQGLVNPVNEFSPDHRSSKQWAKGGRKRQTRKLSVDQEIPFRRWCTYADLSFSRLPSLYTLACRRDVTSRLHEEVWHLEGSPTHSTTCMQTMLRCTPLWRHGR